MFQKIKDTFFDVVSDFKSSIFHVNDLLIHSQDKHFKIFFAFVILLLLMITFRSESKSTFYINLFMVIFVSLISYFIFCLSDYFWFLIKKKKVYTANIKYKKNINICIKRLPLSSNVEEDSIEKQILSTVGFYSGGYKVHTNRYGVEIVLLLLILLFTYPSFFLLNIGLFCGMFVYTFIYEQQSSGQAFDDISLLLNCINELHKENPEKCKSFIIKNKQEEVKELKKLYQSVLKII